jgi:uncharacterized protein (DUF2249 family)
MVELDLRRIAPFERHKLVFEKWGAPKRCDTLNITNDHDPKPLCLLPDPQKECQMLSSLTEHQRAWPTDTSSG